MSRKRILTSIVAAQFACTSLWFVGNAILSDILLRFGLSPGVLGHLTSAVQFGFITGTLVFALVSIADRYSPSKVFFACALAGALSNLGILLADNFQALMFLRILTGFCLAGIYPVGMKIASDHHDKGLGKALGYLVGALVVGTAFPHLLKGMAGLFNWKYVVVFTSMLAAAGGVFLFLFVPDGPHRTSGSKIDLTAMLRIFKKPDFRSAAFGYFGHMWELYTFWAFIPVILGMYPESHSEVNSISLNVPLTSFLLIATGFPACVAGGYLAERIGSGRTAQAALLLSLLCCLLSPVLFQLPLMLFLGALGFWSMAVVADSPQFSTLVAHHAPAEFKGTALTMVNCLGFSITIVSLQVINLLRPMVDPHYLYLFLAPGPFLGLLAMRKRP
ncbi:MAG TPA: MFS transporter [Sphingobacteriaceae bacterium]